jgi:DNA-directed RNA polymerase specialized sigma24 family protein
MIVRAERLLRQIRRLASPPADPSADAAFLARFLRGRDEDAFAALVARHGPMVLGVCRRLLDDAHLAEDAAQATFLVLARHAASVRPADSLAAWLHGTARHLALRARRADGRAPADS